MGRTTLTFLAILSIFAHVAMSSNDPLTDKTVIGGHLGEDSDAPELPHRIPGEMCKYLLNEFSKAISNYTMCSTKFARPIELCLRCRVNYLSVMRAFSIMEDFHQENVTCNVVLTKQDRLSIIDNMYNFNTGPESLWEMASCKNCYEENDVTSVMANHTKVFKAKWNATVQCFKLFVDLAISEDGQVTYINNSKPKIGVTNGSLCLNCSKIYDDLRQFFWNTVVPTNHKQTLSGVCYDIRDAFNLTGIIWKDQFNCEPRPTPWGTVIPIMVVTILLTIMVYIWEPIILPYICRQRLDERVALVQQDPYDGTARDAQDELDADSDIIDDGNFEVIPGVSANEWISRFKEYEMENEDGTVEMVKYPPPPHEYYDLEWNNDNWVMPPEEVIRKMHRVQCRRQRKEITEHQEELLLCKIIADDLDRKRRKKAKRTLGMTNSVTSHNHGTNELASLSSVSEVFDHQQSAEARSENQIPAIIETENPAAEVVRHHDVPEEE